MNKKKQNGHVIRVSPSCYKRLQEARKDLSYHAFIESLLDVADKLAVGDVLYLAAGELFIDLKEARGASIVQAVKNASIPEMPEILVRLGKDDGR